MEAARPDTAPVHAKAAGLYMICTLSKHDAEAQGLCRCADAGLSRLCRRGDGRQCVLRKDGTLHTPIAGLFPQRPDPPVGDRHRQGARQIPVVERHIKPEEMESFSECFLTGSAAEVTPVSEIGPYRFKPGALTEKLMNAYADEVRGKISATA